MFICASHNNLIYINVTLLLSVGFETILRQQELVLGKGCRVCQRIAAADTEPGSQANRLYALREKRHLGPFSDRLALAFAPRIACAEILRKSALLIG